MSTGEDWLSRRTIELITIREDGDLVYGFDDNVSDSRLTAFALKPADNRIPLIEVLAHCVRWQFEHT